MAKSSQGPGGLHWSPASPGWEVEGSVTAIQMLSELIKLSCVPSRPTFVENRNKCE